MSAQTLTFEIGTEEIPAFDLKSATEKLPQILEQALDGRNVGYGEISVYSTPRRMAVVIEGVSEQTEAVDEVFKGPSVKIAFDEEGNPTKAASGFARGKGVDVSELEVREEGGVEYVFASRHIPAQEVTAFLPEVLLGVLESIPWPKSMRWASYSELFSRPVRWIVALFGTEVIPLTFAGAVSRRSRHPPG